VVASADNWAERLPADEWEIYQPVLELANEIKLRFALGGGLAFSYYTRMWRNTKDMDLFVLPGSRNIAIDVLTRLGFSDYYDQVAYDRSWIYRGFRDGVIIDIIWQMANHRAEVDEGWLKGPTAHIKGMPLQVIPVEELIFAKLYVLQRERCDWPDLLNLLFVQGAKLNWSHLRGALGDDLPLLIGLLQVFAWLCPHNAGTLSEPMRELMLHAITNANESPRCDHDARRPALLDSRPWFVPLVKNRDAANTIVS
jgi:hypothetical protein